MSPMQKKNSWLLALVPPTIVGLAVLVQIAAPGPGWQYWLVRGLALSAYQLVFLATLSTANLPALAKLFGRPFIKVHHVATISAFVAMVLHPLGYAFVTGSFDSLVPRAASVYDFFLWAGRPALVLFLVAVITGALRLTFKKSWRTFHFAVYLGFLLATVHANLIGASFASLPVRIVSWIFAAVATVVFVRKRLQRRKAARPAAPAEPATPSA